MQAERSCSEDSLVDVRFELKDVAPNLENLPDAFHRVSIPFGEEELQNRMANAGVGPSEIERAKQLLVWFGFLGYWMGSEAERFSYQYQHDLSKMMAALPTSHGYTVHRAFRSALECVVPE